MNTEIEAKFTNVNHDDLRLKLKLLGAVLEQPKRLMRRVVIHTPKMTSENAFIRVRDEGYRTTITYKRFDKDSVDGAKEYEVTASDFDNAVSIFKESGIEYDTYQESKRENWRLGDVEIMLDEWPWINPYVEIEGASEELVKKTALQLNLVWSQAIFGGVANVYLNQYPNIGTIGVDEINHNWSSIRFKDDKPAILLT